MERGDDANSPTAMMATGTVLHFGRRTIANAADRGESRLGTSDSRHV